jgi:fructose-1-phosphate kinase PfkB-like protein
MKARVVMTRGTKIFQKTRSHLKIPGARRVTQSKFHTEGPQILGAKVQNLVARTNWHTEIVHPW